MVESGTKMKPSPNPWTMPVRTMSQLLMSVLNSVISHMEKLVSSSPSRIRMRTSTRPDSLPTSIMANMVPTPRGASR
ncbi:hypothetical protein D3C84_682890 [compost metagenome]